MTLKATIGTKVVRLPGERDEDFPLPAGEIHLPQGVRVDGSPVEPDVFDLENRLTLPQEWDADASQPPQERGKRYAALERALAQYEGIERVDGEQEADSGESTISQEGDE